MSAIGPGDYVECVKSADGHDRFPTFDGKSPQVGGVYTVLEVVPTRKVSGECRTGLKLCGFLNRSATGRPGAWPAECFRPVSGGSKGMFDHLLQPVKEEA